MEVEVKSVRKTSNPEGNLRGFADVLFGGEVLVKGCRIVNGQKGLFVSLPQSKGKDEKYYPIVNIVSEDIFREFQNAVLSAYDNKPVARDERPKLKEEEEF